jgi:hypothetical protein
MLCAAGAAGADSTAPAGRLHPFFLQEDPIIDGPSSFWLMAATDHQPHALLWCESDDDWDEILKVDGVAVSAMTRDEMIQSLFHHGGGPAHLTAKAQSGPARSIDCYPSDAPEPAVH